MTAAAAASRRGRPRRGELDLTTRFADDPGARAVVEAHPEGAPLEAIAAHLGISREGARLIEQSSLVRFARRCELAGITAADLAAVLARGQPDDEYPDHGLDGKASTSTSAARDALACSRVGSGPQSPEVLALIAGLDSIQDAARARRDVERVVDGMSIDAWGLR